MENYGLSKLDWLGEFLALRNGIPCPDTFRRVALNSLNLEQSLKRSNRQKSNRAATDNNYMLTVLAACLSQHYEAFESACQ